MKQVLDVTSKQLLLYETVFILRHFVSTAEQLYDNVFRLPIYTEFLSFHEV